MARRRSFGTRVLLVIMPPLIRSLFYVLGVTWRFQVRGKRRFDAVRYHSQRPIVCAGLHSRLAALIYLFARPGHRPWKVLVSGSTDGEFIARTSEPMGYTCPRGSSGKGGHRGYVEMVRGVRADPTVPVAFLVDGGGRGPRGHVKPGVIRLARSSRAWLVPVVMSTRSAWILPTWDRAVIPKPFARIEVSFLKPRLVFAHDDAGFEQARQALEDELVAATQRLDALAGLPETEPVRLGG